MPIDYMSPIVMCLALIKTNPHELVVNYRARLRWAADRFLESSEVGSIALILLLRYDRDFGRCPENTLTLKTWIASNNKNIQDDNRDSERYFEDIDELDSSDIEQAEIPAIEVVIDGFLCEAVKRADEYTYKKAIMATHGHVPFGFPKELAKTLTPTEISRRYVRDRWSSEPKARTVLEGDWVAHAEDISQLLDDHLVTSEENRVYTGFNAIDSTVVIGKKFLKWIGILGYTNHGKSAFLLPLLYNMARAGHNVLLVPREYSVEETWTRLTWMHSNYFPDMEICSLNTWLRTPQRVTNRDMDTKNFLIDDLKNRGSIKGSIDVRKLATWEDIEEYVEANHSKKQYTVVAVDYMAHLEVKGRDQVEAKNAMFRRVQMFSQDFNNGEGMVVITPLQANKTGAEAAGKKAGDMCGVYEGVSAVDWFTQAAHDMDLVIGVWHEDDLTMKISCAKSRGQHFQPFFVSMDKDKSRYVYDPQKKYNRELELVGVRSASREDAVLADIIDGEL